MISKLVADYGDEAHEVITYFEKFKLIESRWEVNSETGRPEKSYRTFYNAFQISTSLTFDEAQELLTVVLMSEKEFETLESKIVEMIGKCETFKEAKEAAKILYNYCKGELNEKQQKKEKAEDGIQDELELPQNNEGIQEETIDSQEVDDETPDAQSAPLEVEADKEPEVQTCLLYTSPSPRD